MASTIETIVPDINYSLTTFPRTYPRVTPFASYNSTCTGTFRTLHCRGQKMSAYHGSLFIYISAQIKKIVTVDQYRVKGWISRMLLGSAVGDYQVDYLANNLENMGYQERNLDQKRDLNQDRALDHLGDTYFSIYYICYQSGDHILHRIISDR